MHNFRVDRVADSIRFSIGFIRKLKITKAIPKFSCMKSQFNLILSF